MLDVGAKASALGTAAALSGSGDRRRRRLLTSAAIAAGLFGLQVLPPVLAAGLQPRFPMPAEIMFVDMVLIVVGLAIYDRLARPPEFGLVRLLGGAVVVVLVSAVGSGGLSWLA